MHLMYTLDEGGNRIYTLKVMHVVFNIIRMQLKLLQKLTDAGKITKSAHPGQSSHSMLKKCLPTSLPHIQHDFHPTTSSRGIV